MAQLTTFQDYDGREYVTVVTSRDLHTLRLLGNLMTEQLFPDPDEQIHHLRDVLVRPNHDNALMILASVWEGLSPEEQAMYRGFCQGFVASANYLIQ